MNLVANKQEAMSVSEWLARERARMRVREMFAADYLAAVKTGVREAYRTHDGFNSGLAKYEQAGMRIA